MRKEKEIQLAICKYLKLKGYFFHRMHNVGVYDVRRGVFRMGHYGIKGVPDIYVYVKKQIIALEVKSEKGKQTEDQETFEKVFVAAGGEYYVVRSLEDVRGVGL